MGLIFSRVRNKPPMDDVLKELENELQMLEEYRRTTEQKKKRLLGTLIFYSIFIYIICAVLIYFYWYKSNLKKRMLFAIPLVIFPFAIWGLKLLLQWIFHRRLELNLEKLTELHKKKRSILNEVKETETYSKAKEILEKYDPEFKKQLQMEKEALKKAQEINSLRRRSLGPGPSGVKPRTQQNMSVTQTPGRPPNMLILPNNGQVWARPPGPPLPRPILPRETGVFDKFIDYVIGDGPSNRYALICQRCFSHNGMALKEEFEYLAFRCCYCYSINPAKKVRPFAPRLPVLEPLETSPAKNNEENVTSTVDEQQENEEEMDKSESEDVKEFSDITKVTEEQINEPETVEENGVTEHDHENLEDKKVA